MGTFQRLLSLLVVAYLLCGCVQQEDVTSQLGTDEVVVHFSAGDAAVVSSSSRAAFTSNNPVTVLVYQRSDNNLGSAKYDVPYKRAEGIVSGTDNGDNLSAILLDGGDLTVEGGHTYDFVLVVNLPKDATVSNGVISDISNGSDIMVGRADNYIVPQGASSTTVRFDQGYANGVASDCNLPHLASKVAIEASVDKTILASGNVKMGVLSAEFYDIQNNASFNFGSTPMVGLTLSGDTISSFQLTNNDILTNKGNIIQDNLTPISSTSDKAVYDKGALLPMPLKTGSNYNYMDIDFTVAIINGKLRPNVSKQQVVKSLYSAKNVQLPEFKAGYQYTFSLVMNGKDKDDPIDLYLKVQPWNSTDWNSEMGNEGNLLHLTVDSWNVTSWSALMGGDSDTYIWTVIPGWSGFTWDNDMGREDRFPIDVPDWSDDTWDHGMGEE